MSRKRAISEDKVDEESDTESDDNNCSAEEEEEEPRVAHDEEDAPAWVRYMPNLRKYRNGDKASSSISIRADCPIRPHRTRGSIAKRQRLEHSHINTERREEEVHLSNEANQSIILFSEEEVVNIERVSIKRKNKTNSNMQEAEALLGMCAINRSKTL